MADGGDRKVDGVDDIKPLCIDNGENLRSLRARMQ